MIKTIILVALSLPLWVLPAHTQSVTAAPPAMPSEPDLVIAAKAVAGLAYRARPTNAELVALERSYVVIRKQISAAGARQLTDADAYFDAARKANPALFSTTPPVATNNAGGVRSGGGDGAFFNAGP
jgi:hypothetical protein